MRTIHIFVVLVLLTVAVPAAPAHAGGVVTVCDEAHLLAALAGGGMVTFTCSGAITLTATITIATDTAIDGSGQNVTISGGNAVRVFTVNEGVTLNLNEFTVIDGNAGIGGGALVNNNATLRVSNSTFSGNTASGGGGGVYGGAVHNRGTLTVSDSIFSANSAGDGGGIYNAGGTVTVSNCVFTGNSARWYLGGGIYNHWGAMTVDTSTFSGNDAFYGAGILNGDGGWLTVEDSTFSGNNAYLIGGAGGGIANYNMLTVSDSTFSGNSALDGAGIRSYAGTLIVSNSAFSGNSANQVGGGIYGGSGTLAVTNSTFFGNSAGSGGGGIVGGAETTIANCTFSVNSANWGGGIVGGAVTTLKNTIVANSPTGGNCSGSITDGGGNLSYPDTTCPGINGDPLLGPLQNNGGPTHTMALGPGSAAIDAGIDAICAAPPVNNLDQRGITRPQGTHCDIGTFEWVCPSFVPPATVDVEDIVAMATRWGWTSGTPGWDPTYDLNLDNKIDIVDIVLVTAAWGHTCS